MEKEIKNLEPHDPNTGVDPYWEARREGFQNGYNAANSEFWERFRREAAKDIVCSVLSSGLSQTDDDDKHFHTFEDLAETSVKWADILIQKLKEK